MAEDDSSPRASSVWLLAWRFAPARDGVVENDLYEDAEEVYSSLRGMGAAFARSGVTDAWVGLRRIGGDNLNPHYSVVLALKLDRPKPGLFLPGVVLPPRPTIAQPSSQTFFSLVSSLAGSERDQLLSRAFVSIPQLSPPALLRSTVSRSSSRVYGPSSLGSMFDVPNIDDLLRPDPVLADIFGHYDEKRPVSPPLPRAPPPPPPDVFAGMPELQEVPESDDDVDLIVDEDGNPVVAEEDLGEDSEDDYKTEQRARRADVIHQVYFPIPDYYRNRPGEETSSDEEDGVPHPDNFYAQRRRRQNRRRERWYRRNY